MYKRSVPSNINRGTWNNTTAYNYGDEVQSGSPASSYSLLNTSGLTGGGGPGVDTTNWGLIASAGATGSTGSTGIAGSAGTNAAANEAFATISASGTIAAPTAGTFKYVVTILAATTSATSIAVAARQTGLDSQVIKNESSFNSTLSGMFDNGQTATILLSAGDTATLTADPASGTSWMIS